MKRSNRKNRDAHAERELRGTFWGIAVSVLLYLVLICAVKNISFVLVAVAGVAAVVTAAVVAVTDRLME